MKFLCCHAFPTKPSFLSVATLAGAFVLWSSQPGFVSAAYAQVLPPPITSSGLSTRVSAPTTLPNGQINYNITGGTRPGSGPNLFHSFGEFGVPTNNIANFLNDTPGLATSNILGRVTGGNPSNILGTIQTTGFGTANLYLINPAGVLFGSTASLNVQGSFHVSTADYLKMADGNLFIANPNFENSVNRDGSVNRTVLSSTSPAAFGFLSSNPAPITFDHSFLSVPTGQTLSVVGGDITMTGGQLLAPSGQINLVSVASPGEVLLPNLQYGPNVNGDAFTSMGTINLSAGATLDVSGDGAGTVVIRGGQFVITDATISADTGNTNGAPVAVDINVTGDLSIADTRGAAAITARTVGSGDAGEILITSANLLATSSATNFFALIDSHTAGTGKGGNIGITTGNLQVSNPSTNAFFFIDSGIQGPGHGGDVAINARIIQTTNTTFVSTGDFMANQVLPDISGATGSAGNVTITADNLQFRNTIIDTSSTGAGTDTQQAGNLSIAGGDINIVIGQIITIGNARGGAITINADRFVTENTFFETDTVFGPGGGITVNANVVELTNGSALASNTFGDGDAGGIHVTATDHVSLLGHTGSSTTGTFRPSGLFSNSFAFVGSHGGDAGNIVVTTPSMEMTGGRINTSTETGGHGGNVTINANVISMSGEFANPDTAEPIFKITDIHPSGIFTKTVGSEFCFGPCGNAGTISITTGSLTMGNGSQIDSGTSSSGQGGEITINATGAISISGTLSNGSSVGIFSRTIGSDPGSGNGGTITLQAPQIQLSNGSSVSASSTGTGPAGNITIGKSDSKIDSLVMQNSSITTESAQSGGGSIEIRAGSMVQLTGSQITTSVHGGGGDAGNITIDPQFVILQDSQIIADAFGGNGGNISIVAGVFFADPNSTVSASSTLGINGTVNIQAPVQNLSGTLAPLPAEIVQAVALLQARCAARLAGGTSGSFVVAGRDGLPLEPGSLLPSPLFVESERSTRLAESLGLPALHVGRSFVESNLALVPLARGCSS